MVIVVLSVVAATAGFVAGRTIRSPASVAADVEPPKPSLITVPVELRELESRVIVRGDVHRQGSLDIGIDPSIGLGTGVPVVTAVTSSTGDVLDEGQVLIEVAERPVIVLQGVLPMFRSLGPGVEGDDVAQLQQALSRLGFELVANGVFDEATERAVEGLYARIGYTAAGLTDEQAAQLDAAREALQGAESQLTTARAALAAVEAPVPRSQVLAAEAATADAEAALAVAEQAAMEAKASAAARVVSSIADQTTAWAAAVLTEDRLAQAEAGVHPDTGVAPTDEELETLSAEASAASKAAAAAEAEVAAAKATEELVAAEQQRLVAAAETSLEIARAQHDELLAPRDTSSSRQVVSDARRLRDDAAAKLAEIEAGTGVRVPLAEVVFLTEMPTRVERLLVERGDIVSGPVMTVSGADIIVESSVARSDRALLTVGDRAVVDDESLGVSFEAEVSVLADEPGGEAPEGRYYMRLTPVEDPAGDVAGLNLRVTIPITSTGGKVLVVPLAALAAGGDGSVRVEVESETTPGEVRTVTVTTGLETTGFVEVTPVSGRLSPGDRVVVGQR